MDKRSYLLHILTMVIKYLKTLEIHKRHLLHHLHSKWSQFLFLELGKFRLAKWSKKSWFSVVHTFCEPGLKVDYSQKGLSKYPFYPISLQFFLQISCSQSKLRIWIQNSTPSQIQALSKNLEEKLKKSWIIVYFHKPFWKKSYL